MQRSFKAPKGSKYYEDFMKYVQMRKEQKEKVFEFLRVNDIEAETYYLRGEGSYNVPFNDDEKGDISLYIVPKNDDVMKLSLCKVLSDGLRKIRKTSKIGKAFANYCVENKIIINIWEPDIRDYFDDFLFGNTRTRRFYDKEDDVFYVNIEGDRFDNTFKSMNGLIEIKNSEFFKALEYKTLNNSR